MEEKQKTSQSAVTESEDKLERLAKYLDVISGMDIPLGDLQNIKPEPIKKMSSKVIDDK
ncbi:hypothetical protein [Rummeliibacillus stabekisii]|uniref:hypothetical protein n=1 Tax=Rummeliibacillus stabekisii TaxID=241244 RepID=UPI00131502A2|nr:hypothetical protein [Rummeliibacillus stabekisii]